jgi:hypothetical protein
VQKDDLEKLLAAAVPFAQQMLRTRGEFYPYGATMDVNGKVSSVAGYTGNDHPESHEIIDLLKASYRRDANAGKILACALAYDVRVVPPGETDKTDAIEVDLDHRDGMTITMFYPYRIAGDKTVTFGAAFAQKGRGGIFSPPKKGG